jgi:PEP-CTERM motif-containing protein
MRISLRGSALAAAALTLSILTPLGATTITSTSVSGWLATVNPGSAQDVAFNPNPNADYSNSQGYTASGFTFDGPDGAGYYLKGVYFGANSLQAGSDSAAQLVTTTPAGGETALLFAFTSSPSASGYTLSLSDGQTFNIASGTTIFGVSVSHAITSATLSGSPGSSVILQGMSFGTTNLTLDPIGGDVPPSNNPDPGTVPEPSTMLLLGSGLLVAAKFRRTVLGLRA